MENIAGTPKDGASQSMLMVRHSTRKGTVEALFAASSLQIYSLKADRLLVWTTVIDRLVPSHQPHPNMPIYKHKAVHSYSRTSDELFHERKRPVDPYEKKREIDSQQYLVLSHALSLGLRTLSGLATGVRPNTNPVRKKFQ